VEKPARTIGSFLWALSPVYTLGLATPVTMLIAAARLRSLLMWLVWPLYIALTALWIGTDPEDESAMANVATAAFMLSIVLGTGHALVIRKRVFGPRDSLENAEAEARRRRELRIQAAEIVRRSPEMALEMRIGRPDLARAYDDGGLIDVNHAPASALTQIPGITPELAAGIVRVRAETGGFVSAEEVAAMTGLPPALTPRLAEYGIFLR